MSRLAEFRALEQKLATQLAELETLRLIGAAERNRVREKAP